MRHSRAGFAAVTTLLSASPAVGAVLALTCHMQMSPGSPPIDKTVYVDVAAATVNDSSAIVTDEVFTWSEAGTERSVFGDIAVVHRYTIDRHTGASLLRVFPKGSDSSTATYDGRCISTTEQKR